MHEDMEMSNMERDANLLDGMNPKPDSPAKPVLSKVIRDIAIDGVCILASLYGASFLVQEFHFAQSLSQFALTTALPVLTVALVLLAWRGAHRINARYLGLYDFGNLAQAVVLTSAALGLLTLVREPAQLNRDVILLPVLFGFFLISLLSGWRILERQQVWHRTLRSGKRSKERRALIIGAGDAGEMIVREMNRSSHSEHLAIGFVDDNPGKFGQLIHGVPVIGTSDQLAKLVDKHNIDEVVIAIPSASGATVRRIVDLCDQCGVRVRTLPAIAEVLRNENHLRHAIREVDIEDLLRREPVRVENETARGYLSAETVMITGGGGSIGSELARQIAEASPANLVLVGKGENSVYEIEQELIQTSGFHSSCIIGDVRDPDSVRSVFAQTRPTIVFHAAAHKHVPLMQNNVVEAIKNNIFATELLCDEATRSGVRKFVYISTDKAVKPSSVMGATKRVGEMIVRTYAQRTETEFAIVRFGNVLGSRGSLIPMLKKQIARGGPIRLTHPEMTRYFMTIPEAVQLILEAGSMGRQAELFILDMGQPMRIVDLAKDLVRLHGLMPGEDIEIKFTGVRPGEKLHEELVYAEEELIPTEHPKIRLVRSDAIDEAWLKDELDQLRRLCAEGNQDKIRQALMELAWGKSSMPFRVAAVEMDEQRHEELT